MNSHAATHPVLDVACPESSLNIVGAHHSCVFFCYKKNKSKDQSKVQTQDKQSWLENVF